MPASDEALLRRIARADPRALGELYDRYGRLVFSLAVRMVGEGESAEEITQDVFVQVWRRANTYRAELGRPLTWLVSIARHRAIDALRRRKARPPIQLDGLDSEDQPLKSADDQAPPMQAELEQTRERVQRALDSLPEEQRSALLLAYFEGLSHRELAERLDQPLGTVKTRLRLGLQKLRQMLEREEIGRE